MPRRPSFLEVLAQAGSRGLGVASNMAFPMYQQKMGQQRYADEQARSERDFAATQDYRNRQIEGDRFEAEQRRKGAQMQGFYRMMGDYMKANKPVDDPVAEDRGRIEMARGYGLIPSGYKLPTEPRETQPKMPPNVFQEQGDIFDKRLSAWENNTVPDPSNPYNKIVNPNRGEMPTREGFFNTMVAPTIPNLMRSYPESFGQNAPDSLYEGFVGKPRPRQQQAPQPLPDSAVSMPPSDWPGTMDEWLDYDNLKRGIRR